MSASYEGNRTAPNNEGFVFFSDTWKELYSLNGVIYLVLRLIIAMTLSSKGDYVRQLLCLHTSMISFPGNAYKKRIYSFWTSKQ